MRQGPLIILSGPSGSGKSTVVRRLLEAGDLPLRQTVSATTRSPREGERDGIDYHFWTPEQFEQAVREGAFLEWAEVVGHRYGTLRSEVEPYHRRGVGVILVIDVQGAARMRQQYPDALSVFLKAPSPAAYEERLRKRGKDSEASIRKRLAVAAEEEARSGEYRHVIVNDDLGAAVARLRQVIEAELRKERPCSTS
ncbi:MAG TPA: guanylate kinase [Gemmataceae bacterium]|nr:guanylate kinase [Gemmataceae bacterium]